MLDGVNVVELDHGIQFQGVQTRPLGLHIDGPVGFPADHPMLEHFRFLKPVAEAAGVTPKFSIPAPTVLDFRLERDALEGSSYGGHDDIFDDLAATYRAAVQAFYDAGCRYLQFDDTAWAYLCSDVELAKAAERGIRTDHLAERYAALINASLRDKPDDLVITTHVCRGNFRSTWISSGGYEPVAEQLLGETAFDGYFLEYDSERAGGFEPLRFLPKGDKVVELGLVTTKSGALEDVDGLKRRIDEAAAIVAARPARAEPAVRLRLDRGGQRPHRSRAVGEDRGDRRASPPRSGPTPETEHMPKGRDAASRPFGVPSVHAGEARRAVRVTPVVPRPRRVLAERTRAARRRGVGVGDRQLSRAPRRPRPTRAAPSVSRSSR